MSVTVIVASYNQVSTLPLVLASMGCQSELPERVIVADDGSCDGTCEWLDALEGSYPFDLQYTTGRHHGYGLTSSENRAAAFADTDRIMLTNADVLHCPTSVEAHASLPEGTVAGGVIREITAAQASRVDVDLIGDWQALMCTFKSHFSRLSNEPYMRSVKGNAMYGVWGGNFSVDTSAFQAVKGFNEEYQGLYGGEEADLIQRLTGNGCSLAWAYSSIALHLGHNARSYRQGAKGNTKYRQEYMSCT